MRIGPASAPVIPTEWSVPYVLFSWLFAAFGAFSALTFAERVAVERVEAIANAKDVRLALRRLPPPRPFGVLSAAFCIALNSIWLMHYIATAGVSHDDREIRYEVFTTMLSAVAILLPATLALLLVARGDPLALGGSSTAHLIPEPIVRAVTAGANTEHLLSRLDFWELLSKLRSPWYMLRVLLGGVLLGTGVFLMHFLGMWSMRVEGAYMHLDPVLALLTLAAAVVGGAVILLCMFTVRGNLWRALVAPVLGAAALGIHSLGYVACTTHVSQPGDMVMDVYGSGLFPAEPYIMVATVTSSLVRFLAIAHNMKSV